MSQILRAQTVELQSNPGARLHRDAADAWERATKAFGKRALITDSWRDPNCGRAQQPHKTSTGSLACWCQTCIFLDRYRKGNMRGQSGFTTDVKTWNGSQWTRRSGTAMAAVPGTSNHGKGFAADVKTRRSATDPGHAEAVVFTSMGDPDRLAWLAAARPHGWDDTEGRSINEHWHVTYYPAKDQYRGKAAPTATSSPTITAPAGAPNAARPVLRRGATGEHVRYLQGRINAIYRTHAVDVDGSFGPATDRAVRQFQLDRGLAVDGIVGPNTWKELA